MLHLCLFTIVAVLYSHTKKGIFIYIFIHIYICISINKSDTVPYIIHDTQERVRPGSLGARLQARYAPGMETRPKPEQRETGKREHSVGWYFGIGCPARLRGGN